MRSIAIVIAALVGACGGMIDPESAANGEPQPSKAAGSPPTAPTACKPRDGVYVVRWTRTAGDCPATLDGTATVEDSAYAGPAGTTARVFRAGACVWRVHHESTWDASGRMVAWERIVWREDGARATGSATVTIEADGQRCESAYDVVLVPVPSE